MHAPIERVQPKTQQVMLLVCMSHHINCTAMHRCLMCWVRKAVAWHMVETAVKHVAALSV